jgi:hypothetical protein
MPWPVRLAEGEVDNRDRISGKKYLGAPSLRQVAFGDDRDRLSAAEVSRSGIVDDDQAGGRTGCFRAFGTVRMGNDGAGAGAGETEAAVTDERCLFRFPSAIFGSGCVPGFATFSACSTRCQFSMVNELGRLRLMAIFPSERCKATSRASSEISTSGISRPPIHNNPTARSGNAAKRSQVVQSVAITSAMVRTTTAPEGTIPIALIGERSENHSAIASIAARPCP